MKPIVSSILLLILLTKKVNTENIKENVQEFLLQRKPHENSLDYQLNPQKPFLNPENPNEKLFCNFYNFSSSIYICDLYIDNPNGFDNFTTIKVQNFQSEFHSNVTQVHFSGISTNFPQIICNHFQSLKKIFASQIEIEKISENSFKNCSNLVHLDLEGNKIREICFEGLKSLKILNLKSNNFSEFYSGIFEPLENLSELILDGNFLKNLPSEIFLPLFISLEKISLKNCKLEGAWKSEWLRSSQKLKYIDIGGNDLKEIEENSFNSSEIFAFLMDENKIGNLNFSSFQNNFKSLKYLIANKCRIIFIDSKLFNEAEKLKFVDLRENVCINELFNNFQEQKNSSAELQKCFESPENRSICE